MACTCICMHVQTMYVRERHCFVVLLLDVYVHAFSSLLPSSLFSLSPSLFFHFSSCPLALTPHSPPSSYHLSFLSPLLFSPHPLTFFSFCFALPLSISLFPFFLRPLSFPPVPYHSFSPPLSSTSHMHCPPTSPLCLPSPSPSPPSLLLLCRCG